MSISLTKYTKQKLFSDSNRT